MASVMKPLLVAAVPEILHIEAKPSYSKGFGGRVNSSANTAASSRDASPHEHIRRSKTVGGIDAAELDMDYPSGLVTWDADDAAPLRKSKTTPGMDDHGLGNMYPEGLIVRNTFLDFDEAPVFLEMRRVKSEPNRPVLSSVASVMQAEPALEITPEAPRMLGLASMLECTPHVGSPEVPTVGSAEHHLGKCKPCGFFWKPVGCSNGASCPYCHLCDPSEKKRRQKERKANLKTQRAFAGA